MNEQLKKAIRLSKKTGDRLMVYDMSNPNDTYIVMGIDDYEKMALEKQKPDLTEADLTDKINRDIAYWKEDQSVFSDDENENDEEKNLDESKDNNFEDNEPGDDESEGGTWKIPESRKI